MSLSLPPFTKAVTWLLAINTGVFLLLELIARTMPDVVNWVLGNPFSSARPTSDSNLLK